MESTYRRFEDKICIWQAARCTSAAPGYLTEMQLGSSSFLDGGLLHNNPSAIARREGSYIWDCPADENFVVSIGCGDMNLVSIGTDNMIARVVRMLLYKTYPAKEEEIRVLWGSASDSYVRLDPKLDIDAIG
ncbi:hypothetical protein B0A48_18864, partial [Cryoendolithus antarcticus]